MDDFNTNLGSGFIGDSDFSDFGSADTHVPEPDDPDYVFQRARYLKSRGKDVDPFANLFVTRFLRFYNIYEQTNPDDLMLLRGRFPNFYKVMSLREDPNDLRDHLIECGILAEGDPEDIGKFLNLDTKVVKAYEKLYYNVRDNLESSGYVFGRLLPGILKAEMATHSEEVQKLVAYTLGWDMFKQFIFSDKLSEDLRRALFDIARRQEGIKLLTAVHMENVSPKYAGFVLERWTEMRDKIKDEGTIEGGKKETVAYDRIQEQMKQLNINPPDLDSDEELSEHEERLLPEASEE